MILNILYICKNSPVNLALHEEVTNWLCGFSPFGLNTLALKDTYTCTWVVKRMEKASLFLQQKQVQRWVAGNQQRSQPKACTHKSLVL